MDEIRTPDHVSVRALPADGPPQPGHHPRRPQEPGARRRPPWTSTRRSTSTSGGCGRRARRAATARIVEPMLQWAKMETLESSTQVVPCRAGVLSARRLRQRRRQRLRAARAARQPARSSASGRSGARAEAKRLRESIARKECHCTTEVFLWPSIVFQPVHLVQGMAGARVWQKVTPLPAEQKLALTAEDTDLEASTRERTVILRKAAPVADDPRGQWHPVGANRSGVARAIEALLHTFAELDQPFDDIRVYTPEPIDDGVRLPSIARNVVLPSPWPPEPVGTDHAAARARLARRAVLPELCLTAVRALPDPVAHHGSYEGYAERKEVYAWWPRTRRGWDIRGALARRRWSPRSASTAGATWSATTACRPNASMCSRRRRHRAVPAD